MIEPATPFELPQPYREPRVDPAYNLGDYLGPAGKRVIINDYLADGQMYVTEGEIILSKRGWESLLAYLDRQQYVRQQVARILDSKMGDVLEWLREAGHDV